MSVSSFLLVAVIGAADPRWGLTFKPADGCLSAAELAERIEHRLGRSIFGANPDVRIEGWLKSAEAPHRWRARLTLVDADGNVKGSREVTSDTASCRGIDDALTLVAAVMIDPAAALKGSSSVPESEPAPPPPPSTLMPPPPPSSEPQPPPRVTIPRLPPREEWPGYLLVEAGTFSRNGQWLERSAFYHVVGRPDLDDTYTRRVLTKALSFLFGSGALTTGVVLLIVQSTDAACVRWQGTPDVRGACLEKNQWPLVSGIVTAAVGLGLVALGALLHATPTSEQEDVDLADSYNRKLKPPSLPVTASFMR